MFKLIKLNSVDSIMQSVVNAIEHLETLAETRAVRAKVSLEAAAKHQADAVVHSAEVERAKKVAAKLQELLG